MPKQLSTEEFIKRAKKVHGDKYDYSLVNYINYNQKIKIICPKHGVFEQIPSSHLQNKGCKKCFFDKLKISYISNNEDFIKKANIKHNNLYDYSLIEYLGAHKNISIVCKKHGVFRQTPAAHLRGATCKKCADEKLKLLKSSNSNEFINKSKLIHKTKYDYSLVEYVSAKTKVKIICPIHGEFLQTPDAHLSGKNCPHCNSSKGELKIKELLENNNLKFKQQKRFKDCIDIRPLPFDFYLLDYNVCIEYDGEQHFEPIDVWKGGDGLATIKKRDKIKTEYCKKENIILLRISYKENVKTVLTSHLTSLCII